jgi:hypothetical protein
MNINVKCPLRFDVDSSSFSNQTYRWLNIMLLRSNCHNLRSLHHILDAPQQTRPPTFGMLDSAWGTRPLHDDEV